MLLLLLAAAVCSAVVDGDVFLPIGFIGKYLLTTYPGGGGVYLVGTYLLIRYLHKPVLFALLGT